MVCGTRGVGGPISSSTHANKNMDTTMIKTAMLIFVFIFLEFKGETFSVNQ